VDKNLKMRILIDIGHPAHVHYYKNLARELENKGHKIYWVVKDIPVAKGLLDYYNFKYYTLPSKSDNITGKIVKQFYYDAVLFFLCLKWKIDILIGTSVSVVHVSKISGTSSILFDDDDDDVQPLITKYVNPFADALLSPDALFNKRKRKDTIYYSGYHELAYLHPRRFIPDPSVLYEIGVKPDNPFFILRFNVFKAHHDISIKGLSLDQKLQIINFLKPYGKIFITTERDIEDELKPFQLKISPEKIHSLMYYAKIFLGDSQTMTSEAALLGTPAIKCNSVARLLSIPNELENKYHLCYSFLPEEFDLMLRKIKELIIKQDLKDEWNIKRANMLKDKIDVTAFWCWFVENWPESFKIMKENPDYHLKFR